MEFIKHHRQKLIAVLLWILALLLVRQILVTTDRNFAELANDFGNSISGSWYGPLIYILAYLLRPIFLLPASIVTALAGSLFGLWWGFFYGMIAGTLSAIIPYTAGRWLGRNPDSNQKESLTDHLPERLTRILNQHPFQAILTMRLLYLPYDTVSLVAGLFQTSFRAFFSATTLGNVPGTFAFVGLGASIEGDILEGDLSLDPAVFGVSLIMLMLSLLLSFYLNRQKSPDAVSSK